MLTALAGTAKVRNSAAAKKVRWNMVDPPMVHSPDDTGQFTRQPSRSRSTHLQTKLRRGVEVRKRPAAMGIGKVCRRTGRSCTRHVLGLIYGSSTKNADLSARVSVTGAESRVQE